MNMLTLIRSLRTRANALETDALALRDEANQLSALVLGEDAPEPTLVARPPVATPAVVTPAVATPAVAMPKTALPSKDQILAKAAQYGVNVEEFMPQGKKPTDQQKRDAARKIGLARRAQEEAAAAAPNEDAAIPATEEMVSLSGILDLDDSDD